MKLSIVSTLYLSNDHIQEFHRRASLVSKQLFGDEYEIIFVDDGSPDQSLQTASTIARADEHLRIIELSRNFGHHKAMMTGLAHANGNLVFLIDSDLEEEPEWLLSFYSQMQKQNADVVYGAQDDRKGKWLERWSGHFFYALFNKLTGVALPKNIVTARLMTKEYVRSLLGHGEREVFLAGLWQITGYKQCPQIIKKHSTSQTTYSFSKKTSLLVNSITSFSNTPLIGIFYIGSIILLIAMLYTIYITCRWGFFNKPLDGWTSLIASIWLLGGMMISFIGIIGVYLSKIFSEVKRRPYTIVKEIHGKKK